MGNTPEELRPSAADEVLSELNAGQPNSSTANDDTELSQLRQELEQAQDRVLRVQAELENYRRRAQREMQEERKFALQPLLADLLPVLDNMERALDAAQQANEGDSLLTGVRMVQQMLLSTLEKHHCRMIPAAGEEFDPTLHEALVHMPSTEVAAGRVALVNQKGYELHGRVIRPAQVVVSSGPPAG